MLAGGDLAGDETSTNCLASLSLAYMLVVTVEPLARGSKHDDGSSGTVALWCGGNGWR
jgi:hypothetical protein